MRVALRRLTLFAVVAGVLAGGLVEAQVSPRPDWRDRFRAYDHDGDGRIDRAEFQAWMVDVFFEHDQGRKGYLTLDDVRGRMTPEVFKTMNQRGDGHLSLPEFLNTLFRDFEAMDTDRQGSITMAEIDAYVRRTSQ